MGHRRERGGVVGGAPAGGAGREAAACRDPRATVPADGLAAEGRGGSGGGRDGDGGRGRSDACRDNNLPEPETVPEEIDGEGVADRRPGRGGEPREAAAVSRGVGASPPEPGVKHCGAAAESPAKVRVVCDA